VSRAFRLVALDADGSLLDESKQVTPRARRAIDALIEKDIAVLLCTGRRYRAALPIMDLIGHRLPVAAHNGVIMRDTRDGAVLARHLMRPETAWDAVRFLRAQGLSPAVFVDRYEEGIDFVYDVEHGDDVFWTDYIARGRDNVLRVPDLLAWEDDILEVVVWHEAARLEAMEPLFARAFSGRTTHHLVTNVHYVGAVFEAYSPMASKAEAVRFHRARLGIPADAVCAIGDDVNDLGMIREAGLGIAMANAVERVRVAADRVTSSNREDGVAKALERWVL
jgi:5-amino-6-(5-phospho-D-ribitylamino)uracil phosphatase